MGCTIYGERKKPGEIYDKMCSCTKLKDAPLTDENAGVELRACLKKISLIYPLKASLRAIIQIIAI